MTNNLHLPFRLPTVRPHYDANIRDAEARQTHGNVAEVVARRVHLAQALQEAHIVQARNTRALEQNYHALRASTRAMECRWDLYCTELEYGLDAPHWQDVRRHRRQMEKYQQLNVVDQMDEDGVEAAIGESVKLRGLELRHMQLHKDGKYPGSLNFDGPMRTDANHAGNKQYVPNSFALGHRNFDSATFGTGLKSLRVLALRKELYQFRFVHFSDFFENQSPRKITMRILYGMDPAREPGLKPPPNLTSNFEDPSPAATINLAAQGLCLALCTILLAAQLSTKYLCMNGLKREDSRTRTFYLTWSLIAVNVVLNLALAVSFAVQCEPRRKIWLPSVEGRLAEITGGILCMCFPNLPRLYSHLNNRIASTLHRSTTQGVSHTRDHRHSDSTARKKPYLELKERDKPLPEEPGHYMNNRSSDDAAWTRDTFRGKLQGFDSGMLEAQAHPSYFPDCSCSGRGCCRIILSTTMDDDGETYLEPTFINCECGPGSYAHHQRQLDIVRSKIQDEAERARQLLALEEGVRWLLLRHREFYKAEIRQDQYWLRQDYARTNAVRELQNAQVLKKHPEAAELPLDEIKDLDEIFREVTAPENQHSHPTSKAKLLQVETEDLFIDEEDYEYNVYASSDMDIKGKGPERDQNLLNLAEQELSPDVVRSLSPDTVRVASPHDVQHETTIPTPSIVDINPASSTPRLTTLVKIQLGRLITLPEVLSRFEDIKEKASAYSRDWDLEDSLHGETIASLYPKPLGASCSCTEEHRLYSSLIDAIFDPSQYMHIECLLSAEIRKSELRSEIQGNVIAERREEVDAILHAFQAHIEAQMSDLQTVQGSEGRAKALAEYLRRYDSRTDLQEPEDLNRISKAVTAELLGQVDRMAERIGRESEDIEMRIEELIELESLDEPCWQLRFKRYETRYQCYSYIGKKNIAFPSIILRRTNKPLVQDKLSSIECRAPDMPLSVLVTGGLGFVGSAIVSALQKSHREWTISVLDMAKLAESQYPIAYWYCDITNSFDVEKTVSNVRPTVIIHTAGVVPQLADRYGRKARERIFKVNVEGTRNILAAAERNGVKAFVWTGSCTVVTDDFSRHYPSIDESWPVSNRSLIYGESKATLVLAASNDKLATCSLRPSVVFGPGDPQMIPSLYACIAKGETPFIIGEGLNMWDLTYVGNVADAHVLAVENLLLKRTAAGQAIFISNEQPLPFRDFCLAVWKEFGHFPPFEVKIPETLATFAGLMAECHESHIIESVSVPRVSTMPASKDWTLVGSRLDLIMSCGNPLESLPPKPSPSATDFAKFDATDRNYRRRNSHRFGHLQYRNHSSQPWQSLANSYAVPNDLSRHPEPANIQQVAIEYRGIVVNQYDKEFRPMYIGQRKIVNETVVHGWQVRFANNKISDIFLEEYNAPTWKAGGPAKRPICVVRFKCTGPADCRDATEGPTFGDVKGDGANGNLLDVDGISAALPLAKLCAENENLTGMEIRLAFTKGTMKLSKLGMWLWPMIVSLLMSSSWSVPVPLTEGCKAPLNDWARAVAGRPCETKGALLREVIKQTSTEWSLKRVESILDSNYTHAQAMPPSVNDNNWLVCKRLPSIQRAKIASTICSARMAVTTQFASMAFSTHFARNAVTPRSARMAFSIHFTHNTVTSQSARMAFSIQFADNTVTRHPALVALSTQSVCIASQQQTQEDLPGRESPQAGMEPLVAVQRRLEDLSIEESEAERKRADGELAEAVNARIQGEEDVTEAQSKPTFSLS
ncbi:MAG: hypothetical protein Q9210_000538 [Variospora velana]